MPLVPGTGDSQRKTKPTAPIITSQSDSGSGRSFDNGAAYLTFNAPDYTGKLPITEYVITAAETGSSNTVTSTISSSLSTFVIEGLKSGKQYKFKIKARNLVYDSDDSTEAGPVDATTVPGTPTSLSGNDLKNGGGLTLSWVAPPNAGSAVTSYTITPSYGAVVSTGNNSTTYNFSGLEVNRGYTFTVQAVNANGPGLTSTPSPTLTPTLYVAPTPTPTPTPPGGGGGGGGGGGSSVTCGACQDVSGTVTAPTCNGEDSYTGYYQKRAQVCSDGTQIACSPGGLISFGSVIQYCNASCGCVRTVGGGPVCARPDLVGTVCGTYSAGCGYTGTYNCDGACVGIVCGGCCQCTNSCAGNCAGPCSGSWVNNNGVCSCVGGATVVATVGGGGGATVGGGGGVTVGGGEGTPTSPSTPTCGQACQCRAAGGIWRVIGCI
jgi:hypothetical protein